MEKHIESQIDFEKFRSFLQAEFERRCKANPSYSLRSYAKHLDIHASCLSVILRGKRPLTKKLVNRFVGALGISPRDYAQFSKLDSDIDITYKNLNEDIFAIISDWKHDAILELIQLEDFVSEFKWVANCLEVTETEVQIAVERLIRLELIHIENGVWKITHENTELQIHEYTTAALKNFQLDALALSKKALETVEVEKRYHGTQTMAINKEDIPLAKEMLREFRLRFCAQMQEQKEYNQVYQLNLGFYPVIKNEVLQ